MKKMLLALPALIISLSGCVSQPQAPTVMVMPGSSKSYDQFRIDDAYCRNSATSSLNGEAGNANRNGVATALTGAAIGTAAGALIGSAGGPHGAADGVAVGAASGLLVGSAIAGGNGANYQGTLQDQYNVIYVQCMYAKGNKVPQSYTWDEVSDSYAVPPDYHPQ